MVRKGWQRFQRWIRGRLARGSLRHQCLESWIECGRGGRTVHCLFELVHEGFHGGFRSGSSNGLASGMIAVESKKVVEAGAASRRTKNAGVIVADQFFQLLRGVLDARRQVGIIFGGNSLAGIKAFA